MDEIILQQQLRGNQLAQVIGHMLTYLHDSVVRQARKPEGDPTLERIGRVFRQLLTQSEQERIPVVLSLTGEELQALEQMFTELEHLYEACPPSESRTLALDSLPVCRLLVAPSLWQKSTPFNANKNYHLVIFCSPRLVQEISDAFSTQFEHQELPARVLWAGASAKYGQGVIVLFWMGALSVDFLNQLEREPDFIDYLFYAVPAVEDTGEQGDDTGEEDHHGENHLI
jgi:hypothetical protein